MHSLEAQIVFCIPMGLGVAFLLWVLWGFWREEQRAKAARREIESNSDSVQPRTIEIRRQGMHSSSTWGWPPSSLAHRSSPPPTLPNREQYRS